MNKYIVTLGASTSQGKIVQCASTTATLNRKPIAVVGDIATHPNGADVLIEGLPTVLLNGKPIVFSTAKTAKGGVLQQNTSVKILSPDSYTGIVDAARIESLLDEVDEEETPAKCDEVKLESDFAWRQLITLAETDGLWIFKFRMADIFGKDVDQDAVDKLHAACLDGSLPNPEIEVCENSIYGLMAAYNTRTNKIYVSRAAVEEAVEDNDARHKLMVALVEEFGHHVDWLLRRHYGHAANPDAEGDEGARFAYQGLYRVLSIGIDEQQNVPFARAQTPQGSFSLAWDIAEVYRALELYTKDRQYGTDDHVADDYEGFKVEDLSKKGGFGHENIQRNAIQRSGIKSLQKAASISYLYRGNWLRDYSQLIAPIFFDPATVMNIEGDNGLLRLYNEKIASDPDELRDFLENVVRVVAIRKFYSGLKRCSVQREAYYQNPEQWKQIVDGPNGLIPGFDKVLGVSVPYDHCDNPKGLVTSGKLQAAGFNKEITGDEKKVNKTYGIKSYLRCPPGASGGYGTKVVMEHLKSKLNGISFSRPADLVRLGGVLHTVQDFYAHSNYAETYLVKMWSDKVVTWCSSSDKCRNYRDKRVNYYNTDGLKLSKASAQKLMEGKTIASSGNKVWIGSKKCWYKKAFFTPIVTGTFDLEDMLYTGLRVLADTQFSLSPEPPKADMEPGKLYANDLMLLLLGRYFDQTRVRSDLSAEEWLKKYFELRDDLLTAKKFVKEKLPFLTWAAKWIEENIVANIEQVVRLYKNIIAHYLIIMASDAICTYQITLKDRLNNWKSKENALNGDYAHNDDPSHTMLAKDDAYHPLNHLAGEMAIDSTVYILKSMARHSNEDVLGHIFEHPLQVNDFDGKTQTWAKNNPLNVLRCCVYSETLESIRGGICLARDAKAKVTKAASNPATVGTNRASRSSNIKDAWSQSVINKMGTTYKNLKFSFASALNYYNGQYREMDAQTFVEVMSLYYPSIQNDTTLKAALKTIWKEETEKKINIVKGNISSPFAVASSAFYRGIFLISSNDFLKISNDVLKNINNKKKTIKKKIIKKKIIKK